MKRILLVTSLLSIAAQTPVHAASQLANVATAGSTQETAKSLWSAITQDAKTIWNQQNTPSQVAAWANDPVTKAVGQKFSNAAATDAQAFGKAADEAAKQYGHLVPPVIAGVSLVTAGLSAKGLYTFAKNKNMSELTTFLHSGSIGDVWASLPVIKEYNRKSGKKALLFVFYKHITFSNSIH